MKISYSLPLGYSLNGKSYVYMIEKVLGQGTFGITYLATTRVRVSGALGEIETELKVAVKEFFMKDINGRSDSTVTCSSSGDLYADYRRKFAREATNLSQLNHPHIVKVLELFEANNTYYYSMEYCEGGTLDALIEKQCGLDVHEALSYFRQIADAMSFMHDNRMLHLDLKPSNIMLRGNGEAVLIDFGLSKQYTASGDPESSTRVGSGTPGYAPLEQANYREGKDFPVTMDVYALGATLFKMLSGTRPPEASELLNEGFPACELQQKGVCDELITCVSTAMSPIKKNRYQMVSDFLHDIQVCGKNSLNETINGISHISGKVQENSILEEESLKNGDSTLTDENVFENGNNLKANLLKAKDLYQKKDYVHAFRLFEKIAEQAGAEAQNGLACCYDKGHGVKRNPKKAYYWFKKAANSGFPLAIYNLGKLYEYGRGVQKNLKEAFSCYVTALTKGIWEVDMKIGLFYEKGWGVDRDYKKAAECYRNIIRKGISGSNCMVLYRLGRLYELGFGVEQNIEMAIRLYDSAAIWNDFEALYRLGYLYEHGIGVEENLETAIMYYKDVSSEKAKRALVRCEEKLKQRGTKKYNFLFKKISKLFGK